MPDQVQLMSFINPTDNNNNISIVYVQALTPKIYQQCELIGV